MKGLYCAIFLVVCLGVSSCGNVFNDQLKEKVKEAGEEPVKNDKESFFSFMDGPSFEEIVSIIEEDDGGMIVAGNTRSFGQGGYDAWIIKLDKFGNILWQKTLGNEGDDRVRSLRKHSGGGYILAGETSSYGAGNLDCWLVKLSINFDIIWERTYGGTEDDSLLDVMEQGDGKLLLFGNTDSYGTGCQDTWVLHVNAMGALLVETTHGLEDDDTMEGVAYNPVTGRYVIIQNTMSIFTGNNVVKVIFVNETGELYTDRSYFADFKTYAMGILSEADGDIIVAGYIFNNTTKVYNPWILKINQSITTISVRWERAYPFPGDGYFKSISAASDGSYLVSGMVDTTGAGDFDMVMMKIQEDGSIVRAKTIDCGNYDAAKVLIESKRGGTITGGYSTSLGSMGFAMTLLTTDFTWKVEQETCEVTDWNIKWYPTNSSITADESYERWREAFPETGETKAVFKESSVNSRFLE